MACPMCAKPAEPAYKPFCSRRCADLDLAKWLSGSYAVPIDDPEEAEALAQELENAPGKPH